MDPLIVSTLIELNRVFYEDFGAAFAATRRRIQPGVRRVLQELPDHPGERWLDLGCGSGALAVEWARRERVSDYLGLDFSSTLLKEAEEAVAAITTTSTTEDIAGKRAIVAGRVAFAQADLSSPGWDASLHPGFAGAMSFAVLHHLPSFDLRLDLLRRVHRLLVPGRRFYHSEWQFQNSPKLMDRRLPWSQVGLDERDLEPGDTLLDWRFALPEQIARHHQVGYRYVHLFDHHELDRLASAAGFRVVAEFVSDGQGNGLGLYQEWRREDS